jgi:hypothetical protein
VVDTRVVEVVVTEARVVDTRAVEVVTVAREVVVTVVSKVARVVTEVVATVVNRADVSHTGNHGGDLADFAAQDGGQSGGYSGGGGYQAQGGEQGGKSVGPYWVLFLIASVSVLSFSVPTPLVPWFCYSSLPKLPLDTIVTILFPNIGATFHSSGFVLSGYGGGYGGSDSYGSGGISLSLIHSLLELGWLFQVSREATVVDSTKQFAPSVVSTTLLASYQIADHQSVSSRDCETLMLSGVVRREY